MTISALITDGIGPQGTVRTLLTGGFGAASAVASTAGRGDRRVASPGRLLNR